jgi:hypothetical protein
MFSILLITGNPAAVQAQSAPPIFFTEVMSSNASTFADEDGDFEDWIEVFNISSQPFNLQGVGLSDNPSRPFKWVFGNVVIQPYQFLVVFASSKDRPLHTNFGISAGGETLTLTAPDGTLIDSFATGAMRVDVSRGRHTSATIEWPFFDQPTPGRENTTQWYLGFAAPPSISQPSGKYAAPFDVSVMAALPEDVVTVTTDGRTPTPADLPAGTGWSITKTQILRARAFRAGYIPSRAVTASYFLNEHSTLPLVSLVTDPASLFDPVTGLFSLGSNPGPGPYYPTANFRQERELPVHVVMFEPDGTTAFELDAGMELQGGISRILPKKSMRIEAKASYGADEIAYQVFPDKPVDSFTHLLLRSSSEDQFQTLFRDALQASLVDVTTLDRQAYRPAVLFINDQYWGIYNLREVATEEYIHDTYGYDEDEIDVIENSSGFYEVRAGTAANFTTLVNYVSTNDLAVPGNYEMLKSMAEVDNLVDYFAAEIFVGNKDWPGNNIRYWRPRADGGKWRILFFDLDSGFRLDNLFNDTLAYATNDQPTGLEHQHNDPEDTFLLRALLRSPEFRDEFIRRFDDLSNIVFAPSRVLNKITEFQLRIWPEMARQIARWWTFGTLNLNHWFEELYELRIFAAWRPAIMPMFVAQKFGLVGRNALTMNVGEGSGSVRINSQVAPAYPYQGLHFAQVPVRLTAIPAEGYRFDRWAGAITSTEPTVMLDMSAARDVVAHFAPLTEP